MPISRSMNGQKPARAVGTRLALLLLGLCSALAASAGTMDAQERGVIVGTVTDATTGRPVPKAEVVLRGRRHSTPSDSSGRFEVRNVAPGTLVVQVRAIGFASASRIVDLARGSTVRLDVALQRVSELPEVSVSDSAPPRPTRFSDFDQRRRGGRGQFLTRDQIGRSNAMNLTELLRQMRGVRVDCAGINCTLQMARSPNGCLPEYILDGRPNNSFGPTIPIQDLEAIELYTGPAETPAEFVGQGGCGTIVLWTKSTP